MDKYGPLVPACDNLHMEKYRGPNESFDEAASRWAANLMDDETHRAVLRNIYRNMRNMPAGRIQLAVGSLVNSTAFNCFVSDEILDSMESIMDNAKEAAETLRRFGGLGFDFSNIRPNGSNISTIGSVSSGPVSFMHVYNAVCEAIKQKHRRGAMMAVLRVDHPDIEEFVRCKQNEGELTNFNISVGITDEFMNCVLNEKPFMLKWGGQNYKNINAKALWDEIMRANWDWAEPGVLFLDRINKENNLHYCETISATNPCGEQPLPPNGACLLHSYNLVKYVVDGKFDFESFKRDIPPIVRAIDNVIDRTIYPNEKQKKEALLKRRMGGGVTGLANALTMCGVEYGTTEGIKLTRKIMRALTFTSYEASIELAKEKGAFPLFEADGYLSSTFAKRLPTHIREGIREYGIRNSHLISIAPTGTISFCADNISGGIEPVFAHEVERTYIAPEGPRQVLLKDYAYNYLGLKGRTTAELSIDDHINMLLAVAPYVDSAISKTINVGDDVTFPEFCDIYIKVWKGGAKGCTTFRLAGKRYGILKAIEEDGAACFIDPETGQKECS